MQIGGRRGGLFVSNKHARLLRSDRQIARLPLAPPAIKPLECSALSVQLVLCDQLHSTISNFVRRSVP